MLALAAGLFVAAWGGVGVLVASVGRSNAQEEKNQALRRRRVKLFLAESKARFVEFHLENGKTIKGRVHEISEDIVTIDIRKLKRGPKGLGAKDDALPSDLEAVDLQEVDYVFRFDEVEDDDDEYVEQGLQSDTDEDEDWG